MKELAPARIHFLATLPWLSTEFIRKATFSPMICIDPGHAQCTGQLVRWGYAALLYAVLFSWFLQQKVVSSNCPRVPHGMQLEELLSSQLTMLSFLLNSPPARVLFSAAAPVITQRSSTRAFPK